MDKSIKKTKFEQMQKLYAELLNEEFFIVKLKPTDKIVRYKDSVGKMLLAKIPVYEYRYDVESCHLFSKNLKEILMSSNIFFTKEEAYERAKFLNNNLKTIEDVDAMFPLKTLKEEVKDVKDNEDENNDKIVINENEIEIEQDL